MGENTTIIFNKHKNIFHLLRQKWQKNKQTKTILKKDLFLWLEASNLSGWDEKFLFNNINEPILLNQMYISVAPRWTRDGRPSTLFLVLKGCQISQSGTKNLNNNRALIRTKLVHLCYWTKIFHPTLINMTRLEAKKGLFKNICHFYLNKWNK